MSQIERIRMSKQVETLTWSNFRPQLQMNAFVRCQDRQGLFSCISVLVLYNNDNDVNP